MPEKIYLSELVTEPGKLARVASKKRYPYDFKSVERGSIEKYEKDGWIFFKKFLKIGNSLLGTNMKDIISKV